MKGVVFTNFMELVDDKFGMEVTEAIVEKCDLKSGGAYTATGTYDHDEIIQLVMALHAQTQVPVRDLLLTFGDFLAGVFAKAYKGFFDEASSAMEFIESVEGYIHEEVYKLYPDAELPKFKYEKPGDNQLRVIYDSSRPFADLCEGLIKAAIGYYKEDIQVEVQSDLSDGCHREFLLTKAA